MLNFLFTIGGSDVGVHICKEDCGYTMSFDSNYDIGEEDKIEELIHCLDFPKQEEMEEYYWELMGDCDIDTELSLIGMMIDSYTVKYEDGFIHLTLTRTC